MVDGYFSYADAQPNPTRIGNICARCRTAILFDQSARLGALPLGTGNKTERLFGYFTWHADDAPPINPLGDLFKTQVLQLATEIGVPEVIIKKPPSADLIVGQTDEGDFGISYAKADQILGFFTLGFTEEKLIELGFDPTDVALVLKKVNSTHWKRKLPTVAMMSASAIGEYVLRPVDY
jgi:NAD+ synthase